MTVVILIGGFLLAGLFLLMAMKPLLTWRLTEGWTYKHPEANRPSETALGINSVVWVIGGVLTVFGTLVLHDAQQDEKDCGHARAIFEARDDAARLADLEEKFGMSLTTSRERQTPTITLEVTLVTKDGAQIGKAVDSGSRTPRFRCTN